MKSTINISHLIPLLLVIGTVITACSEKPSINNETTQKPAELITITGIVTAINFGKDGYTADVQTDTDGAYAALVSIVNVGGRENYKSCEVSDKVSFKGVPTLMDGKKQLKVTEVISVTPTRIGMLIEQNAFRGIKVGDAISTHTEYTRKSKLKTGEGTFDVYEILDFDNNPAGYFLPDPKNAKMVGDITVQSPKAETAKHIKIGSTFQDLLTAYPAIEVHGSEIEGRTTATAGNLSYRLDMANFSYEVDRTKVAANTKIKEITINRKVN